MLNAVILQGRITSKGVEAKTFGTTDVFKFTINYSEKVKDEWKNNFFDCTAFGKTGAMIQNHFQAGSAITIEGTLKQDQWEKDGQKQSKIGIIVNRVHFNTKDKIEGGETEVKVKDDAGDVPF